MDTKTIQELIKDLITKTGTTEDIKITECVIDEKIGGRCFSVDLENAHPFLSREGEGLSALNHLVRRILENKTKAPENEDSKELDIIVDINDFQKRKIENLRSLVHMMAERARYFKSSVELEPMSSYERRIVHEFLSDATDIKTESEGVGRGRHVVIRYTSGI